MKYPDNEASNKEDASYKTTVTRRHLHFNFNFNFMNQMLLQTQKTVTSITNLPYIHYLEPTTSFLRRVKDHSSFRFLIKHDLETAKKKKKMCKK